MPRDALRLRAPASAQEPAHPAPAIAGWRERLSPYRLTILAVLLLALGFYMWTAASSVPFSFSSHNTDIYNELTTAFLHGHAYLPFNPPAGLLHLRNPYDPQQNAPYQARFHDLALRGGHFYAPWGPTPAVTLFALFRLTTLKMSESFAVALFAFVGLLCAVALLHVLVRRLAPDTPRWAVAVASAGLALSNVAPFLLRRPAVYEVAISCGYCFAMAGLWLIVTAMFAQRRALLRLAAGSLCLGLAIGARPTLIACGAAGLVAGVHLIRHGHEWARVLLAALAPLVVCGLLLAAYNEVRFGSVSEFGQRYQLAGLDVTHKPTGELSYVPPGVFSYVLLPPRVALTFPHVFLMTDTEYPGSLPTGYTGTPAGGGAEPTGGLLATMPITLLLLALPFLWRRRRDGERPVLLAAAGLTAIGAVIVFLLSYALWGTTQRYEVDYATLFLIGAFLVWAVLLRRCRPRPRMQRGVAVAGIGLTGVGALVGVAVSFTGYYDELRTNHPGVFATLEDITSPLATLATIVAGKPVIARVDDGAVPVDLPAARYSTFTETGASTWAGGGPVTVVIVAPSAQRRTLRAVATAGPQAPRSGALSLRVRSPGAAPVSVPVRSGYLTIPIRLHLGLNRIVLSLPGVSAASTAALRLSNIVIVS